MLSIAVLNFRVHTVNLFYKTLAFCLKVKLVCCFFFPTKYAFIKSLPYCSRHELEGTEFIVLLFYYIPSLPKRLVVEQGNKGKQQCWLPFILPQQRCQNRQDTTTDD